MRSRSIGAIAGGAIVLLLTVLAAAQSNQQNNAPRSPWKYYPADRSVGDGGPAPKRDLTGTWPDRSLARLCRRAASIPKIRPRHR